MKKVYGDKGDDVYLEHDGCLRETDKAKLYSVHGEEIWIPKSVIKDDGDEIVIVAKWFASKNGLESDW